MKTLGNSIGRHALVLLCLVLGLHTRAADAKEPLHFSLATPSELRQIGIALDLAWLDESKRVPLKPGDEQPFPNRCFGGMVTVSDALLNQFRSQGFSLASLCIGLASSQMAFDPETGNPLTRVQVKFARDADTKGPEENFKKGGIPNDGPSNLIALLTEIPPCLAKGAPYLDCTMKYSWETGEPLSESDREAFAHGGQAMRDYVKLLLAKRQFTRACSCNDLQVASAEEDSVLKMKPGVACRVDKVPSCPGPEPWSHSPGGLYFEFQATGAGPDEAFLKRLGLSEPPAWGMQNEFVEISPDLPYGFAHTLRTPEGDQGAAKAKREPALKPPRTATRATK